MKTTISARHGKLSEAAQEKIVAKVEKLGRLVDRVSTIDVTVDLEKEDEPTVTVLVSTELKKDFTAEYTSDNLYGCLDQVIAKIEMQMRKFKEQLTDHR